MEVNITSCTATQEWPEVTVEELKSPADNALATGPFGSSIGSRFFEKQGVPVIRGSNLSTDSSTQFVDDGLVFVSESKAAEFRRSVVIKGDLVFTCWGTINQVGLIGAHCSYARYVISNKQMKLTPDAKKADSLFLFYLFSSPAIQRTIINQSIGSSVPGFNLGQLRVMRLRVPPLPEQRAIAGALSDMDALIGALDQIIAKKHDLKQAAMQQLLTCQKRLPGFDGEWKLSTLKQAAEIQTGINKALSEMGSGTLYVTVQDLYHGTSIRTERLGRIRVSPSEIQARTLALGDIVFGKSSVKRDGIGYPSQFLGCGEPVVFSGFTYRARARQGIADATFLFYSLRSSKTRRWLIDNSQASALTNINQSIADAIPIAFPPLPEQSAIAGVLSDMDAELAALEHRREKSRALKKGMMQELLTGRTRIV